MKINTDHSHCHDVHKGV